MARLPRFRFSLTTLLSVVLILSILLACWVHRYLRESEIADAITSMGGAVYYDVPFTDNPSGWKRVFRRPKAVVINEQHGNVRSQLEQVARLRGVERLLILTDVATDLEAETIRRMANDPTAPLILTNAVDGDLDAVRRALPDCRIFINYIELSRELEHAQ